MSTITRKETDKPAPMDLWDYSKIVGRGVWEPVPHINLIIMP